MAQLKDHTFPWEDVHASRRDAELQAAHQPEEARARYIPEATPCPECNTPPARLTWIYFRSPDETWRMLCGTAGWLTICDWCERQVDYFEHMLN
jgi:hypothetical protein